MTKEKGIFDTEDKIYPHPAVKKEVERLRKEVEEVIDDVWKNKVLDDEEFEIITKYERELKSRLGLGQEERE